jgi:folate-binding protein YgfZ
MSDPGWFPTGAGSVSGRTDLVWVRGPDSISFLDGLLSQNIGGLGPGEGERSLLLAPNGKLRAILHALRNGDEVGLLCDAMVTDRVREDLLRFKIRVDVEIELESRPVWEVWGPQATAVVGHEGPGMGFRETGFVAGFPLLHSDLPRLVAVGSIPEAPAIPPHVFEQIRIAHGEPVAAIDLDDKVIPQEVLDVTTAVDFEKGCYLGQELVARIESRGHVNRRMAGFLFWGDGMPAQGSAVVLGEQTVGKLTSIAASPELSGSIALGMVRAEIEPGTEIVAGAERGRVAALPLA